MRKAREIRSACEISPAGEVKCTFGTLLYKFLAEFGLIRKINEVTSSGRYIAAHFSRGEGKREHGHSLMPYHL